MADFFPGGSEAREAPSSSDLTLQQHNLFLMNPLGHALTHAPPSDNLPLGVPTTVDMSTTTTTTHHHQYYNNLCFGSPVDPNPNLNPTREVNPGLGGSHGLELLPRQDPPPPLAMVSPGNGKKLFLSLSSQQPQKQILTQTQTHVPYMTNDNTTADHMEQGNSPVSTVTNGVVFGATQSSRGSGLGPRYLKAAQELLDEIVSIGDAKKHDSNGSKGKLKVKRELSGDGFCRRGGQHSGGVAGRRKPTVGELTAGYRQELLMKKAKLVSIVEEVEHKYRHYHDQMQTIVSSFEQAAGFGAAKSYTSLALQTISKQFRCLKDAINSQIKLTNKCLGEEYSSGGPKEEGCRSLRLVDQQLHHLGIMQHHHANAWRPQRGLPERAVSILRGWLFEHFLHPYPRDLDKQMLAKQTGLTRSQVSNWFINARVRLWKPMVEEMYLEEMNGQENTKDHNFNGENENFELEGSSSKQPSNNASDPLPEKSNLYESNKNNNASDQCSSSIVSTNCVAATSHGGIFNPHKKLRTIENNLVVMQNSSCSIVSFDVERKQQVDHTAREAHLIHFNGGFENYHHHAMYGNGVSLSLGLPHSCDQTFNNIQFGTTHQIEFSGVSPSTTYQNIDIPDKKSFVTNAAPLLPDFFA